MFLQRLVEHSIRLQEQGKLLPPLYFEKWVRYVIELDIHGNLLNTQPIDLSVNGTRKTKGQRRAVPDIARASEVKPRLLADDAEYTFGLECKTPERAKHRHAAYLKLLRECVHQTNEPIVKAVFTFLNNNPMKHLNLDKKFDRSAVIIFRVNDQFAHRQSAVQEFWAVHNKPSGFQMKCIVCGEEKPVLKRLQTKIKGIPSNQTSGTVLISADKPAFESYGLEASHIAPTCMECGDRFTKSLNYLLSDDDSHILFIEKKNKKNIENSMVFVFWTREPEAGFTVSGWFDKPEPQAVKELINAVRSGKWDHTMDETAFFAVSFSSSGGRAVVRDWIDTTVGRVKTCVANWFQGQSIVGAWGEDHRPLNIYALAAATVRELKDVRPPTYRILLRAGLTGAPLPWSLLQQAVRRNHAEGSVTRSRAALIKLVMATQNIIKENEMVRLQKDHLEPAYHCGRLLAVLESIQRSAIPNITTTIVDRFYGTASMAPAAVFGRLIRGAQPHLSKLRRDNPKAGYSLEKRMEEVLAALPTFPCILDLKQQGFFALGYYHQQADERARALARSIQKAETELE